MKNKQKYFSLLEHQTSENVILVFDFYQSQLKML